MVPHLSILSFLSGVGCGPSFPKVGEPRQPGEEGEGEVVDVGGDPGGAIVPDVTTPVAVTPPPPPIEPEDIEGPEPGPEPVVDPPPPLPNQRPNFVEIVSPRNGDALARPNRNFNFVWKCEDPDEDQVTGDMVVESLTGKILVESDFGALALNEVTVAVEKNLLPYASRLCWGPTSCVDSNDNSESIEGVRECFDVKDDGLVLWWPFERGGFVEDASGFGRNGAFFGSPVFVPGKIGSAISLDGGADFVQTLSQRIGISNSWTIAMWILFGDLSRDQTIVTIGTLPPPEPEPQDTRNKLQFILKGAEANGGNDAGKLNMSYSSDNGTAKEWTTRERVFEVGNGDNWYHLVITKTPQGNLLESFKVYVDGSVKNLVLPESQADGFPPQQNTSRSVFFGSGLARLGVAGSNLLDGEIDEFRISSFAWTKAQVDADMNQVE